MARIRKIFSIKEELVSKSREAALAAVQIFNNPQIEFKSELFIVTTCIAWTYMMHAYYRDQEIDYRYFLKTGQRKKFDKTKGGAYKHWELERCLNDVKCPLDQNTKNNLKFLIGIRHEIEHQMTNKIDASLSAKFQACCLNFNHHIKKLFGNEYGIDKHLSISLQFAAIELPQQESMEQNKLEFPHNINSFVTGFEKTLTDEEYNSPLFAYRVLFVPKTASRKGHADQVIELVKGDSEVAAEANKVYIKEIERTKYLPSQIISDLKSKGIKKFKMHQHTELWKKEDAKAKHKGFGVMVANTWYWYQSWYDFVINHCQNNLNLYK